MFAFVHERNLSVLRSAEIFEVVPESIPSRWDARKQQIFPGESLCGLAVPTMDGDLLQASDIVWFVDNEAAVSSLIQETSDVGDVHLIAQCAALLTQTLRSRVWYEWVDSDSNPADGLSRLGLEDPWPQAQGWDL